MRLVIVHYHLAPGGVARVIEGHVQAILSGPASARPERVVVLHGGQGAGPAELAADERVLVRSVPGLDYGVGDADLPIRIKQVLAEEGCRPADTIVHVHNHALAKNLSLPDAVRTLAADGYRLLLQIHDFLEDLRPADYSRARQRFGDDLAGALYPMSPQVHYGVLSEHHAAVLIAAGVPRRRLHVLANPVMRRASAGAPEATRARLAELGVSASVPFLLYPARGIRRKNLGEALLWSALLGRSAHVGLTLPPQRPIDCASYRRWMQLASSLGLRCSFGLGARIPIGDNLTACDAVLTTSVAESFGLNFLESAAQRRPLVGRDLPDVTKDFAEHGMTFPGLGARIEVPVAWIGTPRLVGVLTDGYARAAIAYGRPPRCLHRARAVVRRKLANGSIDFGDLDANLQSDVLTRLGSTPRARTDLLDANPWISVGLGAAGDPELLDANASVVEHHFSLAATSARLAHTYRALMASVPGHEEAPADAAAILESFLDPDRFRAVLA